MSNQIQITGGAKVRALDGVITGTTGVLSSVPLGGANGVATLDSSGKVPLAQLPASVFEYKGTWNATTNTPYLVNGVGTSGWVYVVSVGGLHDFGAGSILFLVGDQVLYDGSIWERSSGATGSVTSVALTAPSAFNVSGSPITTSGTLAITGAGTTSQYINGAGSLTTFPSLTGFVPYTGAANDLNLGTHNLYANNFFDGFTNVAASGTQIVLTIASTPSYTITGSGGQTIKLPDATTLPNGAIFSFNNNQSSGAITINNNSNTLVVSVPSGGFAEVILLDNSIAAGSWDRHFKAPSNVSWSTNTLDYAGSITSATWNGNVVAINRGGTGSSTQNFVDLTTTQTIGGAKTFTSALTASSLIKTGGTSSQFLKADGSVDSNSYITLTSLSFTAGSGAYNNTTGVITIPTNNTQITNGANYITLTSLSFAAGSGSYNNTTGVITIPTNNNQIINGSNYITLASLSATSPIFYNSTTGVISSQAASATLEGYVTTGVQNFAGLKTFNDSIGANYGIALYNGAIPALTSIYYAALSGNSTGLSISYRTGGGTTYTNNLNFPASNNSYAFPSASGTIALVGGSGVGTVTSVAALTLGTTGTDLSSTVANSTTTPVITLNVPTASATNRGALSSTDWTTFNNKQSTLTFSSPLVNTSGTISIPAATTSVNGYLTSTDWTTFNNKQNALTNPITGTGTSGQVTYFNGTSTVTGSSNYFWDNTNGRLGIGTSSPLMTLDVNGATYIRGWTTFNSTDVNGWYSTMQSSGTAFAYLGSTGQFAATGGTATDFGIRSQNAIAFYTNGGNERMRINSAGVTTFNANVNFSSTIGNGTYTYTLPSATGTLALTSNLSSYLPLTGGTLTSQLYINPANTATVGLDVASDTIRFRSDNLEGYKRQLAITMGSGTLVQMTASGYGANYGTDLAFYTATTSGVNGSPAMYITGGNQIGIGTGSPSYTLDVTGTGRFTDNLLVGAALGSTKSVTAGSFSSPPASGYNAQLDYTGGTRISQTSPSTEGTDAMTFVINGGSTSTTGNYFAFKTQTGNTTPTEVMRITKNGNVGIGVSPFTWDSGTENALQVKAASIYSYGNYELGLQENAYYNSGAWKYMYSTSATQIQLSNGEIIFRNATSGTAGAGITWAERMRITSGGNVGIGTSSPAAKLEVNGNIFYSTYSKISTDGYFGLGNSISGAFSAYDYIFLNNTAALGGLFCVTKNSGGSMGGVYLYNAGTSWIAYSDERLKNIKEEIIGAVDILKQIRAVKYTWKSDTTETLNVGVIAQDIQKVLPEIIDVRNDEMNTLGVRHTELIPVLIAAIKEQQAQIEELKAQVQTLLNK